MKPWNAAASPNCQRFRSSTGSCVGPASSSARRLCSGNVGRSWALKKISYWGSSPSPKTRRTMPALSGFAFVRTVSPTPKRATRLPGRPFGVGADADVSMWLVDAEASAGFVPTDRELKRFEIQRVHLFDWLVLPHAAYADDLPAAS